MVDIATFDINTVKASEYAYTVDTSHNILLSRSLSLSGVKDLDEWTPTNGGYFATKQINTPSTGITTWTLINNLDLINHIWIKPDEKLILDASLNILTNGKITLSGELNVNNGELDVSGGSIESTSVGKTNYDISGGDFYELFYNNEWWRSPQTNDGPNAGKTFSIPRYRNNTWVYGGNRSIEMTENAVTKLFNLYTWNSGSAGNAALFNLADFAIDQWVVDISNNLSKKITTKTVTTTTTSNSTTTKTEDGSSNNIPSSNVGLRHELLLKAYLDKLNNCLTSSLTWGNLLKALDRFEGSSTTTRFDLVDTPKTALQSGDKITIIIMVQNKNALAENIFLRLPIEIK
jgi:hypothetical protein